MITIKAAPEMTAFAETITQLFCTQKPDSGPSNDPTPAAVQKDLQATTHMLQALSKIEDSPNEPVAQTICDAMCNLFHYYHHQSGLGTEYDLSKSNQNRARWFKESMEALVSEIKPEDEPIHHYARQCGQLARYLGQNNKALIRAAFADFVQEVTQPDG
ncbi:hypothetical protein [Ferrimonas marina]|uniref:Uncharacterized protein n=1 Tax=Ferrimonas marina TaxID=299255 RepID=A0A1M5TLC1_9GAMM|nr:hypothetical protein [Ferrimonas marina]SHH51476.1 hypothetical protein SAMN02745129_2189 [Ferrimonas marina]